MLSDGLREDPPQPLGVLLQLPRQPRVRLRVERHEVRGVLEGLDDLLEVRRIQLGEDALQCVGELPGLLGTFEKRVVGEDVGSERLSGNLVLQ